MIELRTDKHGVPFWIDEADLESVSRYAWHLNSDGYVQTNIGKRPRGSVVSMQLFLLGPPPPGTEWDHIDRNKRNNCRGNLRAATDVANQRNVGIRKDNGTGVKGVTLVRGRWIARIRTNGLLTNLGSYRTKEEATAARHRAERELWSVSSPTQHSLEAFA